MNQILVFLYVLLVALPAAAAPKPTAFESVVVRQGVGIGVTAPNTKAALDISSTTKGVLLPRMSTTQRDAISSPPVGLTIDNTTTGFLEKFNGISYSQVLMSNGVQTVTGKTIDGDDNTIQDLTKTNFKTDAGLVGAILQYVGIGTVETRYPNQIQDSQNIFGGANFNAEAGSTAFWSETGSGTLAATTFNTNNGMGSYSFSFDASANNDYASTDSRDVPAGLQGAYCSMNFMYKGFDANITAQVYSSASGAVIAQQVLTASTDWKPVDVLFNCPSSGSVEFRLRASADAAIGYWDELHVGKAKNITNVSQATFYGSATQPGATNCAFAENTSTSSSNYIDLGTAGSCASPWTTVGPVAAVGVTSHQITLANMPPGNYKFEVISLLSVGTASTVCNFRISDGTNNFGYTTAYGASGAGVTGSLLGHQAYTDTATRTFKVQAADDGGTVNCAIDNAAPGRSLIWNIYRFPSGTDTAANIAARDWRVDATITGGNPSLGGSAVSSYTGLFASSLTLVNNPGTRVIAAQIPCSSTNPPTGTTCSAGDESVGVSFNVPTVGDVRACVSFGSAMALSTAGYIVGTFQLIETPNNAQTISQEGKSKYAWDYRTAGALQSGYPYQACGTFTFNTIGQKTIRLMYEQITSGTIAANLITGDADTSVGQRDIRWEVYPLNQDGSSNVYLKAPTIATLNSGTAATYTVPTGVKYLKFKVMGGGGGGAGSGGTTSGNNGGQGGTTTFAIPSSTTLISAGGGMGGKLNSDQDPTAPTSSITAPAVGVVYTGGIGGSGTTIGSGFNGGDGCSSPFGGAGNGKGGTNFAGGNAARANSGSGGGGANVSANFQGGGGNCGDMIEAYLYGPLNPTYTYTIGAGGTAGAAGSGGSAGGTGGSGKIVIEEHYY